MQVSRVVATPIQRKARFSFGFAVMGDLAGWRHFRAPVVPRLIATPVLVPRR